MNKLLQKLVRPNILALEPYSTARDEFQGGVDISVWLDANENPFPSGVNRYPDPHQVELKQRIAELKGCRPEQIFIGGSGSDEAIDLIFRTFCIPGVDNCVSIAPTYGVYTVAAAINDVEVRTVPLRSAADAVQPFALDVEALLAACDDHTKLMWVCSPNNPTANAFPAEQLLELAERFPGILVIDEAYVDFSEYGSMISALAEYWNIIVMQTFSKAWGMASLRVGMTFSAPEIAEIFARVKYPYNLSGPMQQEVLTRTAPDYRRQMQRQVATILAERRRLERELPKVGCVERVFPSQANFLLVKVSAPADIYQYLLQNGVIVRNRSKVSGCEGCLRITVGTPQENSKLLSLLSAYEA
jgi:histidinol-phosphate aminotransferase